MPTAYDIEGSQSSLLSYWYRQSFYANGRHFVFVSDGTDGVYYHSTDGSTWSGKVTWESGLNSAGTSQFIFDGTYFHYVILASADTTIYYRRGTPNSDGSITWSAAEQSIATTGTNGTNADIAIDTNGIAYITYRLVIGGNSYPHVTRNDNTDGTWSTTAGYPLALYSTTSDVTWSTKIFARTGGKMCAVYGRTGADLRYSTYNGSSWNVEGEITATGFLSTGNRWIGTSDGDTIHIVYDNQVSTYFKYHAILETTTWTLTNIGDTGVSGYNYLGTITVDTATHDVYYLLATYNAANHIHYKKWTSAGGWDAAWTDWITEAAAIPATRVQSFRTSHSGYIGITWLLGAGAPYDLRTALLLAPSTASTIYIGYLKF
jgi:hypothetical protein